MPDSELDALIVENLADLDATVRHLNRIEAFVFEHLDEFVERWAEENGWAGNFNYLEEELWLSPGDWKTGDDEDPVIGWFWLDVGAGDTQSRQFNEDQHYLTRLCGSGVGQLGFKFAQEIMKASRFKRLAHELAPIIQDTAFSRDPEGHFYMPFKLDQKTLASAIRNESIEDAFEPLRQTLEKLKAAKPSFDRMLANIKEAGE